MRRYPSRFHTLVSLKQVRICEAYWRWSIGLPTRFQKYVRDLREVAG